MEKSISHLIEAQCELAKLAELAEKFSADGDLLELIESVKQPLDLVVSRMRSIDADLHD
ncbi:MAG: hypothetical protein HWQ38_27185 [Nostoc sp. NMS7]|uniref:hypothetical protein n=1 Tax=Nostoc sp. NMS7 TaxID=2815391 RepID=UPI0025CB9BB2|nr:hypothetical protein [Nostoc sp. NMS7]MBN3949957.1 hypothetical protein [Nostoc sp. NMS7]